MGVLLQGMCICRAVLGYNIPLTVSYMSSLHVITNDMLSPRMGDNNNKQQLFDNITN